MTLRKEIIDELQQRYQLSRSEAERRYRIFQEIDALGLEISQRRKLSASARRVKL